MQTTVKKWFRDKNIGFLDNGKAADIMVSKADLIGCKFLKVGATVQFECHVGKKGLVAKNVKLLKGNKSAHEKKGNKKEFRFGVMT